MRASVIMDWHADESDAAFLSRATLLPRSLRYVVWVGLALIALVVGGQLLLRPGYDIG